jgi:putative ABC transport system substrate-binding protein
MDLAARAPDVILASGNATITPLLEATRQIPVVFDFAADPVGSGYAESLARPGGNATGFMQFKYGLSGKWVELLLQLAPRNEWLFLEILRAELLSLQRSNLRRHDSGSRRAQ